MQPAEVAHALSKIVQSNKPSLAELRSRAHAPFRGVVRASDFRLNPLGRSANVLHVLGEVKEHESGSIVTVEIKPPIARLLVTAGIMMLFFIVLAASVGIAGASYLLFRISLIVVPFAIAVVASVRFGIAGVRRLLMAALVPGADHSSTDERSPSQAVESLKRLVENPDVAVNRLDAWLRERTK